MIKSKIKKILVALDGSKNSYRGLDMGIYLARQCNTKIVGIYVISKIPDTFLGLKYPEKPLLIAADDIMENAKIRCAQNGILFEKKIDFGDPGLKITKFAKSLNFDIVIIGARGMSNIKEIFLGSVSNYVLHKCTIPVIVVK